ncbi:dTDP-4-dehydrorhamnose 3,5-epimerase [Frondihabitans sp. 762G35]|uniref:dTDP-4-dehydrorhamnose 3,5-epimerase family protein n=1 Tax=Frondihabitans sp. 762G35 TaxID=1446794 RepID=UPI000D202592|nr:dTDP-4-dehydrorhamnose 3,5-epimerase family protein [Frondihabitans sp. 762G35]ARC57442.1 dTDP-4-dehydrorhamnose 3,5-epimerase [Frondihabitans sp. 762G35]
MQIRELSIPGAWEFTPKQHADERGVFFEQYRFETVQATVGHALDLKQMNTSVSTRGVVRGIHYALVPPSQAKYVSVPKGAFIDFVIDIRTGSPTFGRWDSVVIDDVDRRAIYLSEGLGHAIVALTEGATVNYLVSEVFNPQREKGLSVTDPEIGLTFPFELDERLLSPKDVAAPTLAEAAEQGLLPSFAECLAYYDSLRTARAEPTPLRAAPHDA